MSSKAAFDSAVSLYLDMGDQLLAMDALTNCAEHLLDQGYPGDASDYLQRGRLLLDALPSPPAYLLHDWTKQHQRLVAMLTDQSAGRPAD